MAGYACKLVTLFIKRSTPVMTDNKLRVDNTQPDNIRKKYSSRCNHMHRSRLWNQRDSQRRRKKHHFPALLPSLRTVAKSISNCRASGVHLLDFRIIVVGDNPLLFFQLSHNFRYLHMVVVQVETVIKTFPLHVVGRVKVEQALRRQLFRQLFDKLPGISIMKCNSVAMPRYSSNSIDQIVLVEARIKLPTARLLLPSDNPALQNTRSIAPI